MTHLVIDREACAGHGLCYGSAPGIVESDEQGDPVILADPVPSGLLGQAQRVVAYCPERALELRE
ncbi:ferredoxin [Kineosporia babensis]|uniref:Ferredoxin n=1 Tax=Kineosporia babensis TaxID=499548 RepID=A0A9X1NF76_9ACTN|nr:ferredoxin [Kineosporia babensis]MCD5314012.1 ferredoxin [Kineosporia babensis]